MPASATAKAAPRAAPAKETKKRRSSRRISEEKEKYYRGFPVAGHNEYEQGR